MEEKLEKLCKNVYGMLEAIQDIHNTPVSDRPVTLVDADLFNHNPNNWLCNTDVSINRRALASAIAAEKWVDGAKAAISLLSIMGII
jgi:hypothetical protein